MFVPHQTCFIILLIAAEATAGALIIVGGRWTEAALLALMVFTRVSSS